jgi:tetratricopeptide (TPR) repeat protein
MLKTRFCSICIFLCVILSTSRISASDLFSNALRIFSEGKFFEASIELERAIFYESDNDRIVQFKYYKSLCYRGLGNYDKALAELSNINLFDVPDSLFFLIRYEQALCNYWNNDVPQSLLNIEGLKLKFRDTSKILEILPLNILCLNTVREWDNAHNLWNYFLENAGLQDSITTEYKEIINDLYKKRNIPKLYSPKKAQNLSRFIPGSGQMYSGEVGEGSLNLLINGSILIYALREFNFRYYFTGYFVGLGLFNKMYTGGMHRANLLASEKNREGIRKFNAQNSSLMIKVIGKSESYTHTRAGIQLKSVLGS